jgi:hypothetical protein
LKIFCYSEVSLIAGIVIPSSRCSMTLFGGFDGLHLP